MKSCRSTFVDMLLRICGYHDSFNISTAKLGVVTRFTGIVFQGDAEPRLRFARVMTTRRRWGAWATQTINDITVAFAK